MIPTTTIRAAAAAALDAIGLDPFETLRACGAKRAMLTDPLASVPGEILARRWIGALSRRPEVTLPADWASRVTEGVGVR